MTDRERELEAQHVAIELQDGLVLQARVQELEAQLREAQSMRDLHKRTSDQLEANNIGLMRKLADQEHDLGEAQAQVAALRDAMALISSKDPHGSAGAVAREALTNTTATAQAFEERIRDDENEACAKIAEAWGGRLHSCGSCTLEDYERDEIVGKRKAREGIVAAIRTRRRAGEKG